MDKELKTFSPKVIRLAQAHGREIDKKLIKMSKFREVMKLRQIMTAEGK